MAKFIRWYVASEIESFWESMTGTAREISCVLRFGSRLLSRWARRVEREIQEF